ncbi:ladderlectin-like isoform X2 [Girardinichthys multiradiatus]|uniref:ladderlectin-like isoform X2 n=1 Tax=Girardinichthys multiradiatus TaxID=208333 RepID=UPI001FAD8FB3|nr:ladderlectin-like isoform X2 [Girardinichthys multiradiatus]
MKILTLPSLLVALMALSRAAGFPFAEDHSETKETLPEATDLVKRHKSCPYGWSQFKYRCYRYFSTPITWARAERTCLSMQATLASVHSFEEYHHIQGVIKAVNLHNKQVWLGGSDAQEISIVGMMCGVLLIGLLSAPRKSDITPEFRKRHEKTEIVEQVCLCLSACLSSAESPKASSAFNTISLFNPI